MPGHTQNLQPPDQHRHDRDPTTLFYHFLSAPFYILGGFLSRTRSSIKSEKERKLKKKRYKERKAALFRAKCPFLAVLDKEAVTYNKTISFSIKNECYLFND
jgi:hypothetical protein